MRIRHFLATSFVLVFNFGCVSQAKDLMDEPRFQDFELQNDGKGDVHDVEIRYGQYVFPTGYESPIVRVPKIRGVAFHQSATVAVPEKATIRWTSIDGAPHLVEVPISSLISNREDFYGIRFSFVDDHVDLAVAYLPKKPGFYATVHYVPAYSSIHGNLKPPV